MSATATKATRKALDFSNVKEGSNINPKRMPEGDYASKIIAVTETEKDDVPMWCFVFQLDEAKNATYPYYCKLQENQLWKVRNLLIAAGKSVPKKRVNVDPNNLVGVAVGITLEDDEYEGKAKSVIAAVFPTSELVPDDADEVSTDDDEDVADDAAADEDDDELSLDDL